MKNYKITFTNRVIAVCAALSCCLLLLGCESSHEKAITEEKNAQKEISAAKDEVTKQKIESRKDIADAEAKGDPKQVEETKIDATARIAGAEEKVDEKKIEGTKAKAEVLHEAGETKGSYQHE